MVLGKLPVPGRPTIWMIVGQGPIVLAVGAGGGCLDIFTLIYPFSPPSPSFWETARYRLKCCLKGPLNPKQPTNQLFPNFKKHILLAGRHNCSEVDAIAAVREFFENQGKRLLYHRDPRTPVSLKDIFGPKGKLC